MATQSIDKVFNAVECAAIAEGYAGFWDWWRQFKETIPHGDTWHCQTCDSWMTDPERDDESNPICAVCHGPAEQVPF
jgi:hypothetical protein